jgi:DNA-directed RNA polymerase specialized sigma24 family protein
MKRYIVKLSEEEQKDLHALTHKGTCGVRKLRRAQMLLPANEGLTDEEIARALDGSVSTVERVRKRFVEEGLEAALSERPSPGARRKLDMGVKKPTCWP